jgi:hypothetical protein
MKEVFVWIDEIQLRQYLKYFGRGFETQDSDFAAAIWMKKFYELKLNKTFTIGFKMRTGNAKDLPDWNSSTFGDLHQVFSSMRKQDDPIDFALSEGLAKNARGRGFGFQVKRFTSEEGTDTTQAIVDYLNTTWKKYGKSKTKLSLLLVILTADFDIKQVHEGLDRSKMPFSRVYFMGVRNPYVYFGEFYPDRGYETYPMEKFLLTEPGT